MTTTTPHTLSQLADIGAAAFAHPSLDNSNQLTVGPSSEYWKSEQPAREAFAKAVLDAVGYKLPVDPEREAFDAWYSSAQMASVGTSELAFQAWKTGREELRKAQMLAKEPAQTENEPENDGWKDWLGGDCPVDKFTKVEVRYRGIDGEDVWSAGNFRWKHINHQTDIIAYKIVTP